MKPISYVSTSIYSLFIHRMHPVSYYSLVCVGAVANQRCEPTFLPITDRHYAIIENPGWTDKVIGARMMRRCHHP